MHKRSKGRVCGKSLSTALAVIIFMVIAAPAGAGELYGLVVGIDDYVETANDLDGAANDANDIAKSLTGAGAKEVVRLINDDASKDGIVAAWEGLVAKAKAGDTIVFSYAGHGGQEPEPKGRHDEADGLNENFLLGRFIPVGPATRERILDDEVFGWMQEADKKGVKVVFVADSCHSGGMERSASAPGVRFRKMDTPTIAGDQLKLPPPEISKLTEDDFANVTFVGAVAEDKLTPEVTILPAGKELKFPSADAPFTYRVRDAEDVTVVAVCNASGKDVDGIKHDFKKRDFTDLGNYRDFITRQIVVDGAKKIAEGKKAEETGKKAPAAEITSRAAIKIHVK